MKKRAVKAIMPPMRKLDHAFFRRPAIDVARELVGKILVHEIAGKRRRARMVETEAYVGPHDLAAHSSKGRTKRTEVMFGPGGFAYVYLIYGMHEMFNIVASVDGDAQAVLIRAGEALDGWKADLSGPGKLARAMRITRADNGIDVTADKLFIMNDAYYPRLITTKRVGVDYAGEWRDALLRFYDGESQAVSKPRH